MAPAAVGDAAPGASASAAVGPAVGPDDTVLLIGVTGITGRCALDGLIAGGLRPGQLLAISRSPSGAGAAAVAARGARVAAADLDDPSSLAPHLSAARFVYVHALSGDAASADPSELRRGEALAAALAARQAAAAGAVSAVGGGGGGGAAPLGLVAYNSSAGRGANAGISQARMDQKHRVADILMASGAPFLGLEATMFMEEWWKKYTRPSIVNKGVFPFSLPADRTLQLVSARDMGLAAAAAFRDPASFAGRHLPLAGDELTPPQMCAAFGAAQGGAPVKHSSPPAWLFWFLSRDLWRITRFLRDTGYQADVAACRAAVPGLLTFPEFLKATHWGDAGRSYDDGFEFEPPAAGAAAEAGAAAAASEAG
ncbi:MAG: hypothetical protein J3K34DRAFT_475157 [Monoraphidium minutum]|nr:MAG: hypothetical protein J3K34DRAFT_475157 [Monoraphidium minutum]